MKVYITCTPEFSYEIVKEVVSSLNKTKGYLEFSSAEPLSDEEISLVNPKFTTPKKIENLTFDEFFSLCQGFRTITKRDLNIKNDDYVVMITSIHNKKDWFSAFQEKNIFIYGLDWEYYTKHDDKFGIAYQVVENIFQSQIELKIDDVDNEPNIHMDSIGCINDMCMAKVDVMLKLRTADICDSCIDRAIGRNVNPLLLQHIKEIIEILRTEFISSNRLTSHIKPEIVHIDPQRRITIGNKKFGPVPLQKVLFIFFLKNPQGVETQLVSDHHDELYKIYKEIRKSALKSKIDNMFSIEHGADPSFDSHKSKLNKALVEALGATLADFYVISNVLIEDGKHLYKIDLEEEYIRIDQQN